MAQVNLGRVRGVSVYTTTQESTLENEITINRSDVYPQDYYPLFGDKVLFANGDVRMIVSGNNNLLVTCGEVLSNLKGNKGDKGDAGVSATHNWSGTTLSITSASGTSSANLKGDKGDPGTFAIAKVYDSVASMNGGFATDGVAVGGLVLIDTGDVNDEDNAKLFVKNTSGYSYLTDLSGAKGIKGSDGVSVTSVVQTTTSNVDGGENVFTITLSNGNTSTFVVKNGSKGSDGQNGKDGTNGQTPEFSINSNGELVALFN